MSRRDAPDSAFEVVGSPTSRQRTEVLAGPEYSVPDSFEMETKEDVASVATAPRAGVAGLYDYQDDELTESDDDNYNSFGNISGYMKGYTYRKRKGYRKYGSRKRYGKYKYMSQNPFSRNFYTKADIQAIRELAAPYWKKQADLRKEVRDAYKDDNPWKYRALKLAGVGDYRSALRAAGRYGLRGAGALSGAASGYAAGGLGGAFSGALSGYRSGANLSRLAGFGDYETGVSGNQLIDGGDGSNQQISVNATDNSGDVYITHTEFLQNVYVTVQAHTTSSPFQLFSFPLNPGLNETFPFLSQTAVNYVLYEFEGLAFQYKPSSGETGSTSSNALGKCILATQYDPDAADFINSVQMENYDYAQSSKPSCGMVHGVETKSSQTAVNMLYVRAGTSSKSKVFTDLGKFFVATEGIPFADSASAQTGLIGELWVSYRIRLSRANLYQSLQGRNIVQDVISGTTSTTALINTIVYKSTNTLGCTIANVSSTAMTVSFPPNISFGDFKITIFYSDVSNFTTQRATAPSAASNLTYFVPTVTLPTSSANNRPAPITQTACTNNGRIMDCVWVRVQAPNALVASVQLNLTAALTNATTYICEVIQVNAAVNDSLT